MMLSAHPLAQLLPDMPAEEYAELVESIRERGLQEPIWTLDGKVLPGREKCSALIHRAVAVHVGVAG